MTVDLRAAGASFVVMAVVPTVIRVTAGPIRVGRGGEVLFRGMPPLGIAGCIERSNGRVCGVHTDMTILGGKYSKIVAIRRGTRQIHCRAELSG